MLAIANRSRVSICLGQTVGAYVMGHRARDLYHIVKFGC